MKNLIILLICLFCFSIASAEELTVTWERDTNPEVIGYKVYMTTLDPVAWEEIADTNSTELSYNVAEDKMYLFRVSAYSQNYEAIRHTSGIWYNGLYKPVTGPVKVGVK